MNTDQTQMDTKEQLKPLFIFLKSEFFDAFEAGTKHTEYRLLGPRWNATTCFEGRPVTLVRGYAGRRLNGMIDSVSYDHCPSMNIPGWNKCYKPGSGSAICIKIRLVI